MQALPEDIGVMFSNIRYSQRLRHNHSAIYFPAVQHDTNLPKDDSEYGKTVLPRINTKSDDSRERRNSRSADSEYLYCPDVSYTNTNSYFPNQIPLIPPAPTDLQALDETWELVRLSKTETQGQLSDQDLESVE